jgi:hypothetical protein
MKRLSTTRYITKTKNSQLPDRVPNSTKRVLTEEMDQTAQCLHARVGEDEVAHIFPSGENLLHGESKRKAYDNKRTIGRLYIKGGEIVCQILLGAVIHTVTACTCGDKCNKRLNNIA